jgi:uroporphyrinogen-III synthase
VPAQGTVPEGWETLHLSPSLLDVGRELEGLFTAVFFLRSAVASGQPYGEAASTPEEAIASLRREDGLAVVGERRVQMLGREGIQVDLVPAHEDSDLRLTFLPSDDGMLVVGQFSHVAELEGTLRELGLRADDDCAGD